MKGSAAAARADAVHGTGCSRQCLPSDVSEDQGGRNARARMRRDAPAAEPPAEGRRLGPYRGCAWEGVRMRRSAKAAQGWPAPKSEQKVTWAAPNGCSYTVFAPARLTACPSTRDHLVPMKERIKAHRTPTESPTWLRRRRCHDSNSHIFIGGQRKRGRNEAYNVIDETSENWVDMDYDA